MKPPPFDYVRPDSLGEAVSVLAGHDNAKILAGGQSLMPMLNLRYVYPDLLVDIGRLPGLAGVEAADGRLRIGAMTRQRRIETDPTVARLAPIFAEALAMVGHRQTRNRGTIGGSLCHLDPAAELPAVCLLHDATIEVAGPAGSRSVPMADFVVGFMTPGIGPDEIVTAVEWPVWAPGHGFAFLEFSRRRGDFAVASAGCLVECGRDGGATRVAVVVGGVTSVPVRLREAEQGLLGTRGEATDIDRAARQCDALDAMGDFHGNAAYRRSVAAELVRRSLAVAFGRARAAGVN